MDLQGQRELFEAARSGNLLTVMVMLKADPLVLDKVALIPSDDTPLHIAAFFGQTEFVKVFLRLKPGLATEANKAGHTPLHIASALGHLEMVRLLLDVRLDVGLIKDKKGQTPLHHAVMRGKVRVIEEFANLCPEALSIVTKRGDTVLHVAVKNNQLPAMRFLLRIESFDRKMVTYANKDGFTVVQLAFFSGHTEELIEMLWERESLYHQEPQSTGGGSAGDIPQVQGDASVRSDRREILANAAANADDRSEIKIPINRNEEAPKSDTEDDLPDENDYHNFQFILVDEIIGSKSEPLKVITLVQVVIQGIIGFYFWALKRAYGFDDNTLQLVAILLVTVSYQGAFPPGIWKDGMKLDYRCMIHTKSSLHSPPAGHCPTPWYLFFVLFNSTCFFCSVALLLLHKRGTVAQTLLAWSLIALIESYIILFFAASPDWISCLATVGGLVILLIGIYCLNAFMSRPVLKSLLSSVKRPQPSLRES